MDGENRLCVFCGSDATGHPFFCTKCDQSVGYFKKTHTVYQGTSKSGIVLTAHIVDSDRMPHTGMLTKRIATGRLKAILFTTPQDAIGAAKAILEAIDDCWQENETQNVPQTVAETGQGEG